MSVRNSRSMGSVEWLLLLILSVLWGGSFFFSKVALAEMGPLTLVMCRVAIAALALNLIVIATGKRMPSSPKVWAQFLVMGALNNAIPFCLIFWGQTRIASSLASILNATTPLWTVLLAHVFTRDERITRNKAGGVLLGLVGVVIMIGPSALGGLGMNVVAQLAVIGAALSYSFAGLWGKRFKGIPSLVTAAGQLTCATLLMIPVALVVERPWGMVLPGLTTLGALAALGLLSTAVAYVIYFRLLSTAGATNLLLVTFLIPVSAMILGTIVLREQLDPRHFVGVGLIGLGLVFIDGRLSGTVPRRSKA